MEITFKNINANQVPVFILSMAQSLKDYEAGEASKQELLAFYGEHFVADNTTSIIKFDTDFSTVVTYQHENSLWQMDKYPAVNPTVSFKDLTPKAPCACCGK
jgi:hypothetical protein